MTASKTVSATAMAPVWEEAARAPASLRPTLVRISGLPSAAALGEPHQGDAVGQPFQIARRHLDARVLDDRHHQLGEIEVHLVAGMMK